MIANTSHEAACAWPDGVFVQGGERGVVFDRSNGSMRTTAFVEAFGDGVGFVRGEGATVAEAESACFARLERVSGCEHAFEPAGYVNGGGRCRHCRHFASKVFTAEELGLSCASCGTPTFWQRVVVDGVDEFYCPDHERPSTLLESLVPDGVDPATFVRDVLEVLEGAEPPPTT